MTDKQAWIEGTAMYADFTHPMDILEPLDGETPLEFDKTDMEALGAFDPELLATLLRVLIFPSSGRDILRAGFFRLVALCHCLHVEGVGDRSLWDLSRDAGCSRALLSHYVCAIRDFAHLDCRAGRTLRAREIYSQAQQIAWTKKQRRARADEA